MFYLLTHLLTYVATNLSICTVAARGFVSAGTNVSSCLTLPLSGVAITLIVQCACGGSTPQYLQILAPISLCFIPSTSPYPYTTEANVATLMFVVYMTATWAALTLA